MESRQRSSTARTLAAIVLCLAVISSVALASVGCVRNAPAENDPGSSSHAPAGYTPPERLLPISEAEFTPPPPPEPEPEPEPEPLQHLATFADLKKISGDAKPFSFALAENDEGAPLSDAHMLDIEGAVAPFDEAGWKSGYLLLDLETGRGVAGNIDERVFGASAIKGPFVHFICEKWLDTGRATLEDKLSIGDEELTLKEAIEDAVLKSGNDSYKVLFATYSAGWSAWVESLGVGSGFNAYQRNPYYTARESALMWLALYHYINEPENEASPHASWLAGMLRDTKVSFMRHAIGNGSVSVLSKPGWYATPEGSEDPMDSFCEAGIVSEEGHPYLLTVMTDAAYKDVVEYPFESIIRSVWDARTDIAIEE